MQNERIAGGKHHVFMTQFFQKRRWQIENDLLAEQLRERRLENNAREMALIERAIAAGISPAIFNKRVQSR